MKAEKEKLTLQPFPERPRVGIGDPAFHMCTVSSVTKNHPLGIFLCTDSEDAETKNRQKISAILEAETSRE